MNNYISPLINWHNTLISAIADFDVSCHLSQEEDHTILFLENFKFVIHLVNLNNQFTPESLIQLQKKYQHKALNLVHLWQDVWLTKPTQVLARLKSLLGLNLKIHGRKTSVFKIDKPTADLFLNENHLQGTVSSRYKLGLFEKETLVAVATFSALRKMNHTENYRSAELIRFAVKAGYSVTGGLSKLLQFFSKQFHPQDIMSYADRDWSNGNAYEKSGFVRTGTSSPTWFSLNESYNRIPTNNPYGDVFNTGSLKYILKL